MSDSLFPTFPSDAVLEPEISFHVEDVEQPMPDFTMLTQWIERVIQHHKGALGQLQYIFCNDEYLHQLNVEYLDHDTLTDIITFPYADPPVVSGDLYISTDRVAENATELGLPFLTELQRVIIHGVLHLCGFGDKTQEEAQRMRKLEEEALAMLATMV
ncbi:rRNA maturation RNase YbeY [Lewinella cohaerens]|uniref:rRNA maturation RNase YbeY n=1 Tax=Lewinella cohaerens TaxID=70995 RepID=UPI0003632F73|nr:rRNA maturation RNase YbeY [Lewinella cohaerens]